MERIDIINCVGREFLTPNIENGEFSYKQVLDDEVTGTSNLICAFMTVKIKLPSLLRPKRNL